MMRPHGSSERRERAAQKALSAIEAARRPAVQRIAGIMPSLYRGSYLRTATGNASPREAIKAHCLECCGWDRAEVSRCTGLACPLWCYRPFVRGKR